VEQCSQPSDGRSWSGGQRPILTAEVVYSEQLRLHIAKLGGAMVLPHRLSRAVPHARPKKREQAAPALTVRLQDHRLDRRYGGSA
jgi:hypothetical protein